MSFIEGPQNHISAFVLALIVLTTFNRIFKEKKVFDCFYEFTYYSSSNPLQEACSGFQKATWLTAEIKVFLNFLLVDGRIRIQIRTNNYGSGSRRPKDRRILRIRNNACRQGETYSSLKN